MKAIRKNVTVTPKSGFGFSKNGLKEVGCMVLGDIRVTTPSTLSARTWYSFGTIGTPPVSPSQFACYSPSNGQHCGLMYIDETGDMRFYPIEIYGVNTAFGATVVYPV